MAININRGVEDAFYRYKMPKLQAKVEGKGNGIKTVIVNATDIANSLSRKPIYVTKYFGCELGAQVNVDEKNERYIVNGAHDAAKLQNILDGFIQKFVLCQSCGNPETVLSVKKNNDVKTKCKACGASSTLNRTHRLTQYIIKNPPTNESSSKKKKACENNEENGSPNTNLMLDVDIDDEADDWGEDLSKEAQQRRMDELSSMAKAMAMSADVEKSNKEKVQMFLNTIKTNRKAGTLTKNLKLILAEADALDLEIKAILIIIEGAIEPQTVIEDIKEHATVFNSVMEESTSSRSKAELAFLAGIILLISLNKTILLPKSAHILKALYDSDIVSEDVIIKWSEPNFKLPSGILSKKIITEYDRTCPEVISKAEVFINWLKEAEEESSEGESDDEEEEESKEESEEESTGDEKKPVEKKVAEIAKDVAQSAATAADDDDLDIDLI